MAHHRVAGILAGIACIGLACGLTAAQETRQAPTNLTLDAVVNLVKAGAPEEAIVAQIKRRNKAFDLNADEIAELKKEGVSGPIISLLMDPAAPYTPPIPPAPPPPPPPPAALPEPGPLLKDPLILKIPPEPGIYWLSSDSPGQEAFQVLEFKPIMPFKPSPGLIGKLTAPIKSGHRIGFLAGAGAGINVGMANHVFYIRLGPKAAIDDIVMVQMQKAGQRRVLDFGMKPDKPVFPPESILPLDPVVLAEGIYRVSVKSLKTGEYVFLVLGSGDEKKGILGKGYEFGAGARK